MKRSRRVRRIIKAVFQHRTKITITARTTGLVIAIELPLLIDIWYYLNP